MTTIITRLFDDADNARRAVDRLVFKGVPARDCDLFTGPTDDERLTDALVNPDALGAYQKGLGAGQTLVVIRTTYKPLGAAKLTREVLAKRGGTETSGVTEDYFVPDGPPRRVSVMLDHPLFLTLPADELAPRGPITPGFGLGTLRPHRTKRSAMSGGRFMSRAFWPMPLLSQKQRKNSVISGGRYMSRAFWPMPLLSNKPRRRSVIPGGAWPLSRAMGWPTVSK